MAPQRTRKRKSTASTASDVLVPTGLSFVPTKSPSRTTPPRSPTKRTLNITQGQKQALIDNLQLEITERARKLRAQYALQAQGLRTRLEIRVHRIPSALRKTTIAELLERYTEKAVLEEARPTSAQAYNMKPAPSRLARPSPAKIIEAKSKPAPPVASISRGLKRTSTDFEADKENAIAEVTNPKKRTRTAGPNSSSDQAQGPAVFLAPPQVLSPRSVNSRTLPQSPLKVNPISPFKSNLARPVSPLKLSVSVPTASSLAKATTVKAKPAKPATTRAPSRQAAATTTSRPKRGATSVLTSSQQVGSPDVQDGRGSSMSDASAGTTIVMTSTTMTKSKRAAAPTVTTTLKEKKSGLVGRIAGMGSRSKKVAAAASAKVEREVIAAAGEVVKGGRVLRKRG